jgi:hypothetical protein
MIISLRKSFSETNIPIISLSKNKKDNKDLKFNNYVNTLGAINGINNVTDLKNPKKELLNKFAKKPIVAPDVVIEEKSEMTKHDSYTYDLDLILQVNNKEFGEIKKTNSNTYNKDIEAIKSNSMSNFGNRFEDINLDDESVKLDLGLKRTFRNDLKHFVHDHSSFSHIEKVKSEYSLNKTKNKLENGDDDDETIKPAFKHAKKISNPKASPLKSPKKKEK